MILLSRVGVCIFLSVYNDCVVLNTWVFIFSGDDINITDIVHQYKRFLGSLLFSYTHPFLCSYCFVSQSLVEDAAKSRKFSTKPEHEKQGSLNSMENGVNGKDKQNLMVSFQEIFRNVKAFKIKLILRIQMDFKGLKLLPPPLGGLTRWTA